MKIQKFKSMENSGITMIALVITIIILLILAGVSISTLIGENRVITKVEVARNKHIEGEVFEIIKLQVMGSYGSDSNIDEEKLYNNLKDIKGLTYKDNTLSETNKISSLPIIVNLNGYDIQIERTGEVKKVPDIISQMIKNPQKYYGKEVTNYKDDGKTYRVFYIDRENYFGDGENTIYLKADYAGSVMCSTEYNTSQTKVREMNPLWAKARSSSENEWNVNEQAAAWLCDPTKWTEYCDPEKANYAVGGPSIEMYVKSYNEAYSEIPDIYVLGTNYRDTDVPGYIYTLNGTQSTISKNDYSTGNNSLDYKKYDNMYCGKNGNKTGDYWIASPCAYQVSRVCFVYGYGAKLDYRNYNSANRSGISPLICLTSSFIPEIKE